MRRLRAAARAIPSAILRITGPEGAVVGGLLVMGATPELFVHLEPLRPTLIAIVAVAVTGVALRFRRGRLFHGMLVLAAAGAATLIPGDTALAPMLGAGLATTLAATLVPINLALLALLPDRGIATRGGVIRAAVIAAQAGGVAVLAALETGTAPSPLVLPVLDPSLDPVNVAYGAALATLALTFTVRRDAPTRGLLWAVLAALGAHLDHAGVLTVGGSGWSLMAGCLALLIASLEDAHTLAFRDALTGLPSRRALDEMLDRSVAGYTLAMVDIDHFKVFNDTHGHDVGDQVLRMVATRLRRTRGGAHVFRYGGEEFTILFKGLSLEEAKPHLERAREHVAAAEFTLRGPDRPKKKPRASAGKGERAAGNRKSARKRKKLSVTISIGAAERKGGSQPPAEVLAAADRALYRAKRAGRDRVYA